ncbi:MAG: hypothetical protein LC749_01210, partial [Actinobacteria bacterium]|nr:hypothetical protein [Actinomycetota bacterium]
MNEFDLISRLSARLPSPPTEVVVPIGDDCAVLRLGDVLWVVATDMLVSGRHFKEWAAPEDVGYKAVAVNVSDVAAMGGVPRFVLASGGAEDAEITLRCMEGVLEACEEFFNKLERFWYSPSSLFKRRMYAYKSVLKLISKSKFHKR